MFVFTLRLRYGAKDEGFQTKVISSCGLKALEKMRQIHPTAKLTLMDVADYKPPFGTMAAEADIPGPAQKQPL